MQVRTYIFWGARIIAAVILLQTLFFKFTGHPESVALFGKLGVEPWGRIATGILELIASVLLLIPATTFWGGLLGVGLMFGAIGSHLLVLGIESQGDGGYLFLLACVVLLLSSVVLWMSPKPIKL